MKDVATDVAIVALRRISQHLRDTQHGDGPAFAAALAQYESGVRFGLTFDEALGLRRAGSGETSWWEAEKIVKRNDLIRNIAAKYFSALSGRPAAAALTQAIMRYQQGRWGVHKTYATPPPELDDLHAAMFRLLKIDDLPAEPTIRRILSGSPKRSFVSQGLRQDDGCDPNEAPR
jgi:hypothetical protein